MSLASEEGLYSGNRVREDRRGLALKVRPRMTAR